MLRMVLGRSPSCIRPGSIWCIAMIRLVPGQDAPDRILLVSSQGPFVAWPELSGAWLGSIWRLAGIYLAPGWDPSSAWREFTWCLAPGPVWSFAWVCLVPSTGIFLMRNRRRFRINV